MRRRTWAAGAALLAFVFPLFARAGTPALSPPSDPWPVALTFDDGPHPRLTAKILDILAREQVHATFFVVGRNAKAHPELLQRMVTEGHVIGNHTWDHAWLTRLDTQAIDAQIERTNAAIESAVPGYTVSLLRPPYGAINPKVKAEVWKHGLAIVNWSADDQDYRGGPAAQLERRVLEETTRGGVVLMHDIHPNTVAALTSEIEALKKKGARFVTVTELMAQGPIVKASYPSPRVNVIEPPPAAALASQVAPSEAPATVMATR